MESTVNTLQGKRSSFVPVTMIFLCALLSSSVLGSDEKQSRAENLSPEENLAESRRDDQFNGGDPLAKNKTQAVLQTGYEYLSRGLEYTKAPIVEGFVKDEQGKPIAGAVVGLGPFGLLPRQWSTLTNDKGRFEMKVWPDCPASICAYAEGYAAVRIPLECTSDRTQVQVTLKAGRVIRGRAISSDRRALQNGIVLFVTRDEQHPRQVIQFRGSTDLLGRFRWFGASKQKVAIFIGKPTFQTVVVIAEPEDMELQVELRPTACSKEFEMDDGLQDGDKHNWTSNVYAYYIENGKRKVTYPVHLLEVFDGGVNDVTSIQDKTYPRILDCGYLEYYRWQPLFGSLLSKFDGSQLDMPTSAWMPRSFEHSPTTVTVPRVKKLDAPGK